MKIKFMLPSFPRSGMIYGAPVDQSVMRFEHHARFLLVQLFERHDPHTTQAREQGWQVACHNRIARITGKRGLMDRHAIEQMHAVVRGSGKRGKRWSVRGTCAGLHVWLEPHKKVSLKPIFERLSRAGLHVPSITEYCAQTPSLTGLLLNFAALEVVDLRNGIRSLVF
jgi:DNA-binding transcriptional MocR family regulator